MSDEAETICLSKQEMDALPEHSGSPPNPSIWGFDRLWKARNGSDWYICEYYREVDDFNVCRLRFKKVDVQAGEVMEKLGAEPDVICPNCNGHGEERYTVGGRGPATCRKCKGTGLVS